MLSTPACWRHRARPTVFALLVAAACGDDAPAQDDPGIDAGITADAPGAAEPFLEFFDFIQAIDVSPDGRLALFGDPASPTGDLWLLDTTTRTLTNPTAAGDPLTAFATGLSNDGRISAVHDNPVQAGVWRDDTDWLDLASPHAAGCDINIAGAWDVSADGDVVVGLTWNGCAVEGFRWVDDGGDGTLTRLDVLGAPQGKAALANNRATVVSDDGQVIAGWASTELVDRAPARWTADGSGELLERLAPDAPGEILAIDATG
jgi:hypothetical protein